MLNKSDRWTFALRRFAAGLLLAAIGLVAASSASAQTSTISVDGTTTTAGTNWGVIATGTTTSIDFSNSNLSKNFTNQYSFNLLSGSETYSQVSVTFDLCTKGCGNPSVEWGIYNANGGLVADSTSVSGTGTNTVILTSGGNYVFQLKGTGFGAGNDASYFGNIVFNTSLATTTTTSSTTSPFTTTTSSFVSAVPEPSDFLLMIVALACLSWGVRQQRQLRPFPMAV